MRPISVVYDPMCLRHDPGLDHPESPQRLQTLVQLLHSPAVQALSPHLVAPRDATGVELTRVHSPDYLAQLLAVAGQITYLDADTVNPTAGDTVRVRYELKKQ